MKLSKYTTDIRIDDEKRMLYNTLSRKYYVYGSEEKEALRGLFERINAGEYTEGEIRTLKKLLDKHIIIQDNVNEATELECLENEKKFQGHTYKIMIYATNACNFRCVYCEQEHIVENLHAETMERIEKMVDRIADEVRCIEIDWFGGEPLLQSNSILALMGHIIEICRQKNCNVIGTMTTNGYLLSKKIIEKLWEYKVRTMQITVDGNKTANDARRVLADGRGTYDVVVGNIKYALEQGMKITLRINVNAENFEQALEVLDEIPQQYHSQVFVSISNIFQNKRTLSTYQLLRETQRRGFACHNRWNQYVHCHACIKNAVVINTNGDVLLCSNTSSDEKRVGYLTADGGVHVERVGDYLKLEALSARNNPECQVCMELPYCIESCKYTRMGDNTKCIGRGGDGLSLEERALLDYYSDLM